MRMPGAFPEEVDVTLSELDDSDFEYDDDDNDEYLNSYDQSLEDSYFFSEPDIPPTRSRTASSGEDEDIQSTSSYGDDYPLDDLPPEEEYIAYRDIPTPTPPSSSQTDPSQPERGPTLPLASSPKPSAAQHDTSESSVIDISSSGSSTLGIGASELSLSDTQNEPPNPPPQKIELSGEQKDVLRRVLAGESLFFTGSAGTGKSVLLREIIKALTRPTDDVAVTASTGIAAFNIGGKTLHSFAGVGLGRQHISVLINKVWNDPFVSRRWKQTTTLIVDEISMVDGDWFDTLETIARSIRRSNKPFGGIQVRLIQVLNEMRVGEISEDACELFHSLSRRLVYGDNIAPTELFPRRLSVELSNKHHLDILPGRVFKFTGKDDFYYDAAGLRITPSRGREILDRLAPPCIELKVDAQVMCVKNLGGVAKLVNGSIGKVVDFMIPLDARNSQKREPSTSSQSYPYTSIAGDLEPSPDINLGPRRRGCGQPNFVYEGTKWPVVEYLGGHRVMMGPCEFTSDRITDGEVQAKRLQVPLILAWALTIHKSQGQTLDRVKVDLRGTFESGQEWSRRLHSWSPISRPAPKYQRPARQPAPPPFGRFKNHPQRFRAAPPPASRNPRWSDDDEEELAARMYHGYDS
ncbi:hypothetical protein FRC06_008977 [Ceratobasidium sp. 370]|nr:hypothetical protein FRC06_008977 [Ceratobasidium sp. 370]